MKRVIVLMFIANVFLLSCKNQIKDNKSSTEEVLWDIDSSKVEVVYSFILYSDTLDKNSIKKIGNDIYNMQLSVKYFDWKNPTSGGAIHITKNDEIEVYQSTFGLIRLGVGVDKDGDSTALIDVAPKDTSAFIQQEEILHYVGGFGLGNRPSVLITSELNPNKSKSIKKVLDELSKGVFDIYYLKEKG